MNFDQQLTQLSEKGLSRTLSNVESLASAQCFYKGKHMLNFSGNDYLGLSTDKKLQKIFLESMAEPMASPWTSASSRLLTGNHSAYTEIESLIAQQYQAESALFFNSGYHANIGILSALCEKNDLILADKLVHASMIDGIRLSSADFIRYRHLDYEQLEQLLKKKRHLYKRVFIVSESVFSMDGDEADLQRLVHLKQAYNAHLYIDEAHAVGAVGANGLGLCEKQNVVVDIDILVGTMGKALASVGAFAVCSAQTRQMLINKSRSLIYTTALPPVNMAWSKFIIAQLPQFVNRRKKLQRLSLLAKQILGIDNDYQGYIIPHVVGENKAAVQLAEYMQSKGYLVFAIRPPTVPEGTARLRLSLNASMNEDELKEALNYLKNKAV